ncbi:TPA: hypothetical protein I8Y09_005054, partial [Raoultella ornithinolytica]|nr:hypothetical protein [Raoultella ornithinolytica]
MKAQSVRPIAEHRDFMDDVRKGVWHFTVQSVERAGVVEVAARDGYERSQIKQLIATCKMMNKHAELTGKPERFEVDHFYPVRGEGDKRGMTNIANLRIIKRDENRSKKGGIPTSYTPEQVIDISALRLITSYHEASKALKRWYEEGEQASDYTPERKAVYEKKQEALKAGIEAIEQKIPDDLCAVVYAAVDAENTSLFDVLCVTQSKLRRFQIAGNQRLVEAYKRRLELHGNRGFVKVEKPDLAAMAFLNKGAVLRAVEATVSNV